MGLRSYEFTCRVCGKTVKESAESEVCADCASSPTPMAGPTPPSPPPPAAPKAPSKPPAKGRTSTTHNIGGLRVVIRTSRVCAACGGKGVVNGKPCPACGGKKK